MKNTPGHAGWEDDEDTPKARNSWDLPTPGGTPGSRRREDDDKYRKSSTRRDAKGRKYEKETPLPTPTYKKNKWAGGKDRKGTDKRMHQRSNEATNN